MKTKLLGSKKIQIPCPKFMGVAFFRYELEREVLHGKDFGRIGFIDFPYGSER